MEVTSAKPNKNIFNYPTHPPSCKWCGEALLILSIIGSVLSIFFLLLSISTFVRLEIKRRRTQSSRRFSGMNYHYFKLMILLCLHLIIFNAFFIAFVLVTESTVTQLACQVIGIHLHFFFLCSFFLMSSMAILRYLLTVKVFTNIKHFNLISVLVTWTLAALIVGTTAGVPPGITKYMSPSKMCWLNTPIDMLSVIVPVFLSLFLNIILFVCIINGVFGSKYRYKAEKGFEMLKFIIGTVFICGLTWSLGFVAFLVKLPDNMLYISFVLAVLFCFLNGFQGVFIFICTSLIRKIEYRDVLTSKSKSDVSTDLTDIPSSMSKNEDFTRKSN